jgi:hypothetical protein
VSFQNYDVIELDLTDFYKDQSNIFTLYDQINEYVATRPEHTQREIYETFYKVCAGEYSQNFSDINYVNRLENNLAKVSELLNYENFKIWMARKEDKMILPENIKTDFIFDPDMNTIEEKTYIKSEYINLISLITFIRALSPLYLNYYTYAKQITNHYYYKLFSLFIKTDIYQSPEIEKLKRYIEANQITLIGNSKNEHLIINAGLSDDDILDSLVSEIIFNKLITIDFFNKKCNIVSFIFQTIKYKGNFTTTDNVVIRGKASVNDPNKEDISYFEDYRKTSDVPIGTVVEIQHALSNNDFIIGYINKPFDQAIYERELKTIPLLMDTKLTELQIHLVGWFLNKVINPRALYYIEYKRLVELTIIAKTFLLSNNQIFTGLLLGSYRNTNNSFINVVTKSGINKATLNELRQNFNFVIDDNKQSIIERTISEMVKEIINSVWVPLNSASDYPEYINNNGYLLIPSNISDLICEFVKFSVTD